VPKDIFPKIYQKRTPKPQKYQVNGLNTKGIKFARKDPVNTLQAILGRNNAAQFDSNEKVVKQVTEQMLDYLKSRITSGVLKETYRRFSILDFIKKQPDPKKRKKLYLVLKYHNKYGLQYRDMKLISEYFQKDPVAEPKYEGDEVKPRGISTAVVLIKNKLFRLKNSEFRKVAESYKSFYNLYCNYVSDCFIQAIKLAQERPSDDINEAIFVHGKNSST